MCRESISLFDLRRASTASAAASSSLVYDGDSDLKSWPGEFRAAHPESIDECVRPTIPHPGASDPFSYPLPPKKNGAHIVADCQYKQRVLIPIQDPESLLRRLVNQKGPIEGYGIEFIFRDPAPSLRFVMPIENDENDDENDGEDGDGNRPSSIAAIEFDSYRFHRDSMTFWGRASFADRPVRGNDDDGYRYDALECALHFSEGGRYVRCGYLRWRYASMPPTSADHRDHHPLDGTWEVRCRDGNGDEHAAPAIVRVQGHAWTVSGVEYRVTVGEDDRPRFGPAREGRRLPDHVSDRRVSGAGVAPVGVGETMEWYTPDPHILSTHRHPGGLVFWKRLASGPRDSWRSVDVDVGALVYRRCAGNDGGRHSSGPRYRPDAIWGNTYCQGFCVGMASYHFLEDVDPAYGGRRAYISYESPRTEMWPALDNGDAVPSRVPFRDVMWDEGTRTFRGDICWELECGTTWMNESTWSYEVRFDPTYAFVESGTVSRSAGHPRPPVRFRSRVRERRPRGTPARGPAGAAAGDDRGATGRGAPVEERGQRFPRHSRDAGRIGHECHGR